MQTSKIVLSCSTSTLSPASLLVDGTMVLRSAGAGAVGVVWRQSWLYFRCGGGAELWPLSCFFSFAQKKFPKGLKI